MSYGGDEMKIVADLFKVNLFFIVIQLPTQEKFMLMAAHPDFNVPSPVSMAGGESIFLKAQNIRLTLIIMWF